MDVEHDVSGRSSRATPTTHLLYASRLVAQLIGQNTKPPFGAPLHLDQELVDGISRSHFASLTFEDLRTIAPWVEPTKWILGAGLGHDD